jgi:hypothetical protein
MKDLIQGLKEGFLWAILVMAVAIGGLHFVYYYTDLWKLTI